MLSVRVVERLDLVGLLLSSSNYNLFSKIKAFGDFSESLFTWQNSSKMLCGSNMVLKICSSDKDMENTTNSFQQEY